MISFLKNKKYIASGTALVGLLASAPLAAFAQVPDSYKILNPVNVSSLSDFIAAVLGIVLKIGIPIVALAIIYSGFVFVAARGNPEKLEKAKSRFLYTLIGAGILLGAWMIATIIKATIDALMS
jgi:hypothetical protein